MTVTFEQLKNIYSDAEKELFSSMAIIHQVSGGEAQAGVHLLKAVELLATFLELQSGTLQLDDVATDAKKPSFKSVWDVVYPVFEEILGKKKADLCAKTLDDIASFKSVRSDTVTKTHNYLEIVLYNVYTRARKQYGKTCCAYIKKHNGISLGVTIAAVLFCVVGFLGHRAKNPPQNFAVVQLKQDFGTLTKNASLDGGQLSIAGVKYSNGYATHAKSEILVTFPPKHAFFSGACGMQDFWDINKVANARCTIMSGDKVLFQTGIMRQRDPAVRFSVPVLGLDKLLLKVESGDQGNNGNHVNWVNLKLE